MFTIVLSTFVVIIPVLVIILIGYILKKKNILTEDGIDSLSKVVFYIGLPALLVDSVSRSDLSNFASVKGPFILGIASVIVGTIAYMISVLKNLPPEKRGVWAQSAFRGNMAFIGIPITLNALGDEGMYYCSLLLAIGAPIYNILSIVFLTLPFGKLNASTKTKLVFYILKSIPKNPLTIGILLGIALSFVRPPSLPMLDITLDILRKIPLPLALIVIGGKLSFKETFKIIPSNITPILCKLVIAPIIGGVLLFLFNAAPKDFTATLIFLGSPTAILSYVMANEMGGDGILTSNLIITTTILSFISYALILFILGLLGIWEYSKVL